MNVVTTESKSTMKKKPVTSDAEIVKEYVPVKGTKVHGVTFDGRLVWYATDDGIVAFDPETEKVARRLAVPAEAGTAWDGEHFYQLAIQEILVVRPTDGKVVRKIPAPGKVKDSGMAYDYGYLWVGEYKASKIRQVDAD